MTQAANHAPPTRALPLVRACLATREQPRLDDWAALTEAAGSLRDPVIVAAGLMPQLLHAAGLAGVELDPGLRSACRAARFHEELRAAEVSRVCREALTATQEEPIVLRGVALSYGVYDEPVLRHCHDLDLLVPAGPGTVVHANGFPVSRHLSLFARTRVSVSWAEVAVDTVSTEIAGVPARVLDPADALIHICVHAATQGVPHSPLWCVDAGLLISRNPDLDWGSVIERASAWKVSAETYDGLALLHRQLDVAVPASALAALAPRFPRVQSGLHLARRSVRLARRRVRPRTRARLARQRLGERLARGQAVDRQLTSRQGRSN